MAKRRYVMSGGLAFSEAKDMEKLRNYSARGWHVKRFAFLGYQLEKGEPNEFQYSIDTRNVSEAELPEYEELFATSGWTRVTSDANFHIFRGSLDAKPIHSERESIVEKHRQSNQPIKPIACISIVAMIALWIGAFFTTGILSEVLFWGGVAVALLAIPATMTSIALLQSEFVAGGQLVKGWLLKLVPLILMGVGLIVLFGVVDVGRGVEMIAYMVVGGLGFSFFVWLVMYLFTQFRSRVS